MWLMGSPEGVALVNVVTHPKVKRSGIAGWGQFLEARFLALVALICIPPWSEAAVAAGAAPAGVAHPSVADTAHACPSYGRRAATFPASRRTLRVRHCAK